VAEKKVSEDSKATEKISPPAQLREARANLDAATVRFETAGLTDEELEDAAKAYAEAVQAHTQACEAVA
jgi:hypothetical protein